MTSDEEHGQRLLSEIEALSLGAHWTRQRHPGLDLLCKTLPQLQRYLEIENTPQKPVSPFLELTGPSCSGKTNLLYYIVAISVLPKRFLNLKLAGLESSFVIVDTAAGASGFNSHRLAAVIRHVVRSAAVLAGDDAVPHEDVLDDSPQSIDARSQLAEEDMEILVQSSLQHVLIYRPASQNAVFTTLETLESTLLGHSAYVRHMKNRPLAGIAVDSVSSFYWQNRALSSDLLQASFALEEKQSGASFSKGLQKGDNTLTRLTAKLLTLTQTFSCFVIVTSWVTANLQFATNAIGLRQPVLPGFQHRFPGLRIVFVQSHYGEVHFPRGISAEEAWAEYIEKDQPAPNVVTTSQSPSGVWQKSTAFIDRSTIKFALWIGDGVVVQ